MYFDIFLLNLNFEVFFFKNAAEIDAGVWGGGGVALTTQYSSTFSVHSRWNWNYYFQTLKIYLILLSIKLFYSSYILFSI